MKEIIRKVWNHEMSVEEAMKELRFYPFQKLRNGKIDFYRNIYRGIPEAIYGEGKDVEEIKRIAGEMRKRQKVFITRVKHSMYKKLGIKDAKYYKEAEMVVIGERKKVNDGFIAVLSAGASDRRVAEEAAATAYELGNDVIRHYDVGVAGLHRIISIADEIYEANVIIAVAGMDGILPTVVSNFVSSPVIAVPTSIGYGTGLNGVSALMAMLNSCSPGIVVVNIDNGFGAGVAAHLINTKKSQNE